MRIDRRIAQEPARWHRMVALGDSLTEGLSDSSRQSPGEFRGWADRLATFIARSGERTRPLGYANLAVRSRRIAHVVTEQIPRAIELRADLVTVFIGANDLVRADARPAALARRLGDGIRMLRATGADVLLVVPFGPRSWSLAALERRFDRFAAALLAIADETGAMVLDLRDDPMRRERAAWAEDRVHLSSHGHRVLSYRAAEVLGLPAAAEVGALDIAMHEQPGAFDRRTGAVRWLGVHVAPWALRRLRGRTAGDGLAPKHDDLVPVPGRIRVFR